MEWSKYLLEFSNENITIYNWLEIEFSKLRTGRITSQVIDHILVDAYDEKQKISNVANISNPEPRVLIIKAYDVSLYKNIAAAINNSGLNVNPQIDADKIRLSFPNLTEETRKEMTKKAKSIIEDAKIKIRRNRQDINDNIKNDLELSDDDKKNYVNLLDKEIKLTTVKLENMLEVKNKEILTI